MSAVWDDEDSAQEAVLIRLEHPDYTTAEVEAELKRRKLQPTRCHLDPDTIHEEQRLDYDPEDWTTREQDLPGLEDEDPAIITYLSGKLSMSELSQRLGVSERQAYRRVRDTKERLRSPIVP